MPEDDLVTGDAGGGGGIGRMTKERKDARAAAQHRAKWASLRRAGFSKMGQQAQPSPSARYGYLMVARPGPARFTMGSGQWPEPGPTSAATGPEPDSGRVTATRRRLGSSPRSISQAVVLCFS